jgi:hypothetical protein
MARIDDVFLATEQTAADFRRVFAAAKELFSEIHDQGWDSELDHTLLRGPVLDIEPDTGQLLSVRQEAVAERLGEGLASYQALMMFLEDPTNGYLAKIRRMAR